MKKFLVIILMLFGLYLVGCVKPEAKFIELSKLETYLKTTNNSFKTTEHGKISVVTTGNENSTFELTYNYGIGKFNLDSFKVILSIGSNVSSCYVKDDVAYMLRDNVKLTANVSSEDATTTINNYSYERYTQSILKMLGPSFWENAKVTDDKDGVAKVEVNLENYTLSEKEVDQSFEFSEYIDNVKESKKSFIVKFTYANERITKVEIELVSKSNDSISKITLSFIELSESEIAIAFPNFSEYPAV